MAAVAVEGAAVGGVVPGNAVGSTKGVDWSADEASPGDRGVKEWGWMAMGREVLDEGEATGCVASVGTDLGAVAECACPGGLVEPPGDDGRE